MNSPFKLLIYAIVALAILSIAYGIYLNLFPPENFVKQLKTGLEAANTQEFLGKYYYIGHMVVPADTYVTKEFFDTYAMSVAMECTSTTKCCPKGELCSKSIEWDYDRLNFKHSVSAELSVRCIRYGGIPVCRFYFVELPAQAKINSAEIAEQKGKQVAVTVEVENKGKQMLTIGKLNTVLYKDVRGDWVETGKEFDSREIDSLKPSEKYRFLWDFDFETPGKYMAEFIFEGSNAGYDKIRIEMDINNEGTLCDIDRGNPDTSPIIDSDKFREIHYCINCDTAYECLSAWNINYPEYEFDLLTKDSVYCIKDTPEECCGGHCD